MLTISGNPLIDAIFMSMLPFWESRYAIPFALANKVSPFAAFFSCFLANILIILIIWLFLDFLHGRLLWIKAYKRFSEKILERMRKKADKVERNMKIYGWLALSLFIALPLPVTGAYTGSLIAWILELERKKSFLAISLGVLIAALITTLVFSGILFFTFLF
jgi:uncharacterized membrane protein